jgi:hypothetical protein
MIPITLLHSHPGFNLRIETFIRIYGKTEDDWVSIAMRHEPPHLIHILGWWKKHPPPEEILEDFARTINGDREIFVELLHNYSPESEIVELLIFFGMDKNSWKSFLTDVGAKIRNFEKIMN